MSMSPTTRGAIEKRMDELAGVIRGSLAKMEKWRTGGYKNLVRTERAKYEEALKEQTELGRSLAKEERRLVLFTSRAKAPLTEGVS